MNIREKELEAMELLKKLGRQFNENNKNNNVQGESTMKLQSEDKNKATTRKRVAQGIVNVLGPALNPSLKMLAFLMFLGFLVIGSIAIIEFSRLFSEMSLKMAGLSIESVQGSLLTIACYVTGFVTFIQRIPDAYKCFMGFAEEIKKAV